MSAKAATIKSQSRLVCKHESVKHACAHAVEKSGLGDDSLVIVSRKDSKKPRNQKRNS